MLGLASGAPPHLTAEGAGGTPSRVLREGNSTVKSLCTHILSVEGDSKRDRTQSCPGVHWLLEESTREDTGSTQRL